MRSLYKSFSVLIVLISALWQIPLLAEPVELNSPIIELRDITVVSASFNSVSIAVDLDVHNSNSVTIVVENILYELTLNDTHIKYGRIKQQESFPAHSERSVRVPVTLAYDEHLSDILAALSSKISPTYELAGSVKLEGKQAPLFFHHKGLLQLPRMARYSEQ